MTQTKKGMTASIGEPARDRHQVEGRRSEPGTTGDRDGSLFTGTDRLLCCTVRPMPCRRASFVAATFSALSGVTLGCSASVPPRPVGVAPTPQTVTVQNPGGDASDPELAALDRLAGEPWGIRRDRTNTLLVPLTDAMHWTRVRFRGYPTRAAFRYGDDHYGVIAIWYTPAAGKSDPESWFFFDRFFAEAPPRGRGRYAGLRPRRLAPHPD